MSVWASIADVLDIIKWVIPVALLAAIPRYERFALWRGHDALDRFVERDGRLLAKEYERQQHATSSASLGTHVARQLRIDLASPLTALIILYIALAFLVGALGRDDRLVWTGGILAGLYAWMLVSTARMKMTSDSAPLFEATLVSLKPPVFLAYGMATLRTTGGKTFQTGVRWRPVEAVLRRDGSVDLVFAGTPDNPTFVGMSPPVE